jgi:hypothetical protein
VTTSEKTHSVVAISSLLASALRAQGRCLCHSKALWPWKREQQCGMCAALEEYEKAIQPSLVE